MTRDQKINLLPHRNANAEEVFCHEMSYSAKTEEERLEWYCRFAEQEDARWEREEQEHLDELSPVTMDLSEFSEELSSLD